jgi:hypothetical protein
LAMAAGLQGGTQSENASSTEFTEKCTATSRNLRRHYGDLTIPSSADRVLPVQ